MNLERHQIRWLISCYMAFAIAYVVFCSSILLFVHLFQLHWLLYSDFMNISEAEIVSDINDSQVPNWTSWDASLRISLQWYIDVIAWTSVVREVIMIAGRLCSSVLHHWGILCCYLKYCENHEFDVPVFFHLPFVICPVKLSIKLVGVFV